MTRQLLLYTLLCAALAPRAAHGGWKRQASGMNQKTGYLDLCAVSKTFAAAAGVVKLGQEKPVVAITTDGKTWTQHFPHKQAHQFDIQIFTSVFFADDKQGYVGGLGMIWSTTDGGSTWTAKNLGGLFAGPISDIHSAEPSSGVFAAASKGKLLRTTDGGKTWPVLATPLGSSVSLNRVFFLDAKRGWVTAGTSEEDPTTNEITGYEDGGLALTTDGGKTWKKIFSGEKRQVDEVFFVDAQYGWLLSTSMSGPRLEASTDGGETWSDVTHPSKAKPGKITSLAAVRFFDRCEGWLAGGTGESGPGVLWRTTDGGKSWTELTDRKFLELGKIFGLPVQASIWALDFVDRETGFAGGSWESLYGYTADDKAPACGNKPAGDGGTGPGDGEEGEGCCSVARGGPGPWPALALLALLLELARRRRRK
jgi:MYXO-CTERM domain-containing protein